MYSVTSMQYFINLFGHRQVVIDGIIGPETEAGIRSVQTHYGITIDGIWGPETESRAAETTLALQNRLYFLGYTLMVDGIPGPETCKQVMAFQRDHDLAVDGIVGPLTSAALYGNENGAVGASGYDPDALPNFTADEFQCVCGCGGDVRPEMKVLMQQVRDGMNARLNDGTDHPLIVTSGFRCPRQNTVDDGIADSLHLCGLAVDVYTPGMDERKFEAITGAAHALGLTCGVYRSSGFVHVQVGRNDFIGD